MYQQQLSIVQINCQSSYTFETKKCLNLAIVEGENNQKHKQPNHKTHHDDTKKHEEINCWIQSEELNLIGHCSWLYKDKIYVFCGRLLQKEKECNEKKQKGERRNSYEQKEKRMKVDRRVVYCYDPDTLLWAKHNLKLKEFLELDSNSTSVKKINAPYKLSNSNDHLKNLWDFSHVAHCVVDSCVYFFGGSHNDTFESNNFLWKLDMETMSLTQNPQKGDCPIEREQASMFNYNNKWLVLYGGFSLESMSFCNEFHLYNLESKTWYKFEGNFETVINPRVNSSVCMDPESKKIYMFGGYFFDHQNNAKYLNDMFEFTMDVSGEVEDSLLSAEYLNERILHNPKVEVRPIISKQRPQAREGHQLVSLNKKYLLLIGGRREIESINNYHTNPHPHSHNKSIDPLENLITEFDNDNDVDVVDVVDVDDENNNKNINNNSNLNVNKSNPNPNPSSSTSNSLLLNDIWLFNLETNQWEMTYCESEQLPCESSILFKGLYGFSVIICGDIKNNNNKVGNKLNNSISVVDKSVINFYIFGGESTSEATSKIATPLLQPTNTTTTINFLQFQLKINEKEYKRKGTEQTTVTTTDQYNKYCFNCCCYEENQEQLEPSYEETSYPYENNNQEALYQTTDGIRYSLTSTLTTTVSFSATCEFIDSFVVSAMPFAFSAFGLILNNAIDLEAKKCNIVYTNGGVGGSTNAAELRFEDDSVNIYKCEELEKHLMSFHCFNDQLFNTKEKKLKVKAEKERHLIQYCNNIILGGLRLGSKVLWVSCTETECMVFCLLVKEEENEKVKEKQKMKQKSEETTETQIYKSYFYAFDLSTQKLLPQYSAKDQAEVESHYGSALTSVFIRKKFRTVLTISGLRTKEVYQKGEKPKVYQELVPNSQTNNIRLFEECSNRIFHIKPNIRKEESIDVSLCAYLSNLFLRCPTRIFISVGNVEFSEIQQRKSLREIDKLLEQEKIVELNKGSLKEFECKILELYYRPDSNNHHEQQQQLQKSSKPSKSSSWFLKNEEEHIQENIDFYSNGLLIYHQGKLLTRYKYQLGEIHNTYRMKYIQGSRTRSITGSREEEIEGEYKSYNIYDFFGFIELPDKIPINIFQNNYLYPELMDEFIVKIEQIADVCYNKFEITKLRHEREKTDEKNVKNVKSEKIEKIENKQQINTIEQQQQQQRLEKNHEEEEQEYNNSFVNEK